MTALFDPADFNSIELATEFKNLTTDRSVDDHTKVSILELGEKHIVFSLPTWACDNGAHVLVKIYKLEGATEQPVMLLSATGKIVELLNAGDGTIAAKLDLIQFDKKSMVEFLNVFNRRQNEIAEFLARGKR